MSESKKTTGATAQAKSTESRRQRPAKVPFDGAEHRSSNDRRRNGRPSPNSSVKDSSKTTPPVGVQPAEDVPLRIGPGNNASGGESAVSVVPDDPTGTSGLAVSTDGGLRPRKAARTALRMVGDSLEETASGTSISEALVDIQTQIYRDAQQSDGAVSGLMSWVVDRRNLLAAWHRVSQSQGAETPGPDGLRCSSVKKQLSRWLSRLADRLIQGVYQPSAPRIVEVPKPNKPGQHRRLGILSIEDRVVHTAIKQVLEPVLEPAFSPNSFGFRPGRSVAAALQRATDCLSDTDRRAVRGRPHSRYTWAVPLDVADCFDSIDHRVVLDTLGDFVNDQHLNVLLGRLLDSAGRSVGWSLRWMRPRSVGLTQGSGLSPLLCNMVLHTLDAELAGASESACTLRYADDLLILASDRVAALRTMRHCSRVLGGLRLSLRGGGGRALEATEGIPWLGVLLKPRQQQWTESVRYGYEVPGDKVRKMLETIDEMTNLPSDRVDASAFDAGRWIVSLNDQLRAWREAYVYADNAPVVFAALDDRARQRVEVLLERLTGLRGRRLANAHRLKQARGYWTWQIDGVRLVTLAALAPRHPAYLIHPPRWQKSGPRRSEPIAFDIRMDTDEEAGDHERVDEAADDGLLAV